MKKCYKEYHVANIFSLVIFVVLLFSCERNNKTSENNGRNNKLLADMSIQELEDKIIECYANDIETTVEYTGTKDDFLQFIDNICGEKYIILNNYSFYDDKELDSSIRINYNIHKYYIENIYLSSMNKNISVITLVNEYDIDYPDCNKKVEAKMTIPILLKEYNFYYYQYQKLLRIIYS